MENGLCNSVGVADGPCCGFLGALSCLLHSGFLLGKANARMMVLLKFLEEIEAIDYDLLAIERDSERIGAKSHFLDTALVLADEA